MKHLRQALKYIPYLSLLLPLRAFAQMGYEYVQGYEPPARNLPATILSIVNWVLMLVGVLALAFLVYGGFLYITSRGDTEQIERAKTTIIFAVMGIVIIGLAAALVNFVIEGMLFTF